MTATGKFLKNRRIELGKSLHDIAMELGYENIQFVYRIEAGKAFPPYDRVFDWAKSYAVNSGSLMTIISEEKISIYARKQRHWQSLEGA